MLANWVKQATATTGTGTITLGSAETGFIAFGDAFGDGDKVHYTIKDGNNREEGIGTYTVTGTTLSRDVIKATLVAGTYDDSAPTAITLSGSAVVSISASSNVFEMPQYPVTDGTYFNPPNIDAYAGTTKTLVADTLYAIPVFIPSTVKVDGFSMSVNTLAAASVTYAGIYSCDPADGEPDQLIQQAAITTTSTGHKEVAFTEIVLNPGWYFMVTLSDGAPVFNSAIQTNGALARAPYGRTYHTGTQLYAKKVAITPGWTDLTTDFSDISAQTFSVESTCTMPLMKISL